MKARFLFSTLLVLSLLISAVAMGQTGSTTPPTKTAATKGATGAQTPPQPGMVWANQKSKVYHKSGDQWYGKGKNGKWMTEADAKKAGYTLAKANAVAAKKATTTP
jgi:hypothetical protein